LRQEPVQAEDRADLRAKLAVASGGVVFTTIQKFFPDEKGDKHPELSRRRNIIVIADEAHRTQYLGSETTCIFLLAVAGVVWG
jgi:type I restriction enzyme R subunit